MNNKWFTKVLSVLLFVVFSVFGLIGCGGSNEEEKKISLNATQKTIAVGESFTLTATTTPKGVEVVWLSSDEAIVVVNNGTVTAVSEGTATVTAKNDTATATCQVTVTAAETQNYTVVFYNGDTQLKSVELAEGETIFYNGIIPSKASTDEYAYTFSGWALTEGGEVVDISTISLDSNKAFYAVFTQSLREYTVTWNIDGETTTEEVVYGENPVYKGSTPTKPTVGNTSYTFKGWATSLTGEVLETLPAMTDDVTYYAIFDEVTAQMTFAITWKNGDQVLKVDENVEYYAIPIYNGEIPEKESTEEYDYVFIGWATAEGGEALKTLPLVTADATYYAVFTEQAKPEVPQFKGGVIMYSARSEEIFLPDALLDDGVTLTKAVLKVEDAKDVVAYENGAWVYEVITLTEEEWRGNYIGERTLEVTLSNNDMYTVQMRVYAGIINELSDFPVFFNNTAVPSETKPEEYPAVAPNTWGYYIVTQDLGTGVEELTFEQVQDTDFEKTNGFNGVLDGQGYTLRFKLMKGGLVGLVLGNAVIKNLGVIYEDASLVTNDQDKWVSGGYGVFGYITNGSPEIRNCYIERTNNNYQKASVFGIMARPNKKLILHNTIVYGYNVSNNSELFANMYINETSTNAYLIHARINAMDWVNVQNFTKVFNDGIENGTRSVLMSDIEDVNEFDDRYWYKANGILVWKGVDEVKDTYTVTWYANGETVTTQHNYAEIAECDEPVKEDDKYYAYQFAGWALSEGGEIVELGAVTQQGLVYYAVFDKIAKVNFVEVKEAILYSTNDSTLFLPEAVTMTLDETVTIASIDETVVYYENGEWKNSFALTEEQIKANAIATFDVTIANATDVYAANVKSYAGVIDELSDFPKFFNNTAVPSEKDPATYPAVAPNVYGYYIVTKDLGSYTMEGNTYTYSDELTFTQEFKTDFEKTNGFNGVLDGLGHTLKFKLMKGGLVGKILGNAVIKNLSIVYEDASFVANQDDGGGYGVFGYMTNGSPEIRNCYIERTNNVQARASVYGLMARPKGRLILRNTVVYGFNCALDATWFTDAKISSVSTNAYIICGRSTAADFGMSTNFTKVYTDGWGQPYDTNGGKLMVPLADVADASGFDGNYWNKETNISWKGAADMAVSVYDAKYVEVVEDELLYSTVDNEMIMPAIVANSGETLVSAYDAEGTIYFADGAWTSAIALTAEEIKANAVRKTVLFAETAAGNTYQLTVKSYAGVIDELSDFPKFFNNTAVPSEKNPAGYPAVAPNVYGYYIVTKDLGTGVEELSFEQVQDTDFEKTNGFNGVLDGQGHTLRFKLMKGGLVGLVLGHAVIKNLGVVYEDATSTYYGVFGYITNGNPEIRNCYIERTNNHYQAWSVFGIMSRPNAKLILHNTVVYGYNTSNNSEKNSKMWINETSTNAYLIHTRANATDYVNVQNFTKVFNDGVENGSREVLLSEIEDASGFDDNYWYKENGKLIWKGLEVVNVTWINGDTTIVESVTKGGVISVRELETGMFWSLNEDGSKKETAELIRINADKTYYACASVVEKELSENALFSTVNNEFFLPNEIGSMSKVVSITSADGATVYYENGVWAKSFALTGAQINANQVVDTPVKVYGESFVYTLTVKSYAGVIDELTDFPKFFNNDPSAVAPNVYGYYIVTKDLGSYTISGQDFTYTDTLTFTQSMTTDYKANNGFNGVLDGAGHTLKFELASGGLVGQILGAATIKNLAIYFNDATSTHYGVFGYMAMTGGPVIENCYIEQTNNHYMKTTSYGLMGRPLGRLILKNTVVYGFNNNHQNTLNGEASAPISTASTNAYVVCGRSGAASYVQAAGFTKVYENGSGLPYDTNGGKKVVALADVTDVNGFNEYWNKETSISWKGATADMDVSSVGEVTVEYQNLAENGATAYAIVLPNNADDTLVTAGEELVSFFTRRRA